MATATLNIDLRALAANWRALDRMSVGETAAVVKADAYGLGLEKVANALAREGVKTYFVAAAEEGAALRQILGPGPVINVFSGHMPGDTDMIGDLQLTPMLNSTDQLIRHLEALPGKPFGIQLDTGMNRLGMEPAEWAAVKDIVVEQGPSLVMSHLACADEADHEMNEYQLATFREMTDNLTCRRSLSATGGTLLGADYHFNMTRPGIGLYGGLPYLDARPVVTLDVPVIQIRDVDPGETVGYGNSWTASEPKRIATIAAGYADGLPRIMGRRAWVWANERRCQVIGRISMDMIAVDVTDVDDGPTHVEVIGRHQSIDTLADWGDTIGYEILTSLGHRYNRRYFT